VKSVRLSLFSEERWNPRDEPTEALVYVGNMILSASRRLHQQRPMNSRCRHQRIYDPFPGQRVFEIGV
jgi:hypothetical protein